MTINSKQLAKALYQSLLDHPDKEKELLDEFVKFVEEKNLLGFLPGVVRNLENLQVREATVNKIKLSVSHNVKDETINEVKKFIGETDVEVDIRQDESMIGGFKAEYMNKVYDGSVKSQLNKIRNKMLNKQ